MYVCVCVCVRDIHVKVPTLLLFSTTLACHRSFLFVRYPVYTSPMCTNIEKCYKVRLLETRRQKQTQALVNKLCCIAPSPLCVTVCLSYDFEGHTHIVTLYTHVQENGFLGAKDMGGKFFGVRVCLYLCSHVQHWPLHVHVLK